jgi:hypothetical protein
MSLWWLASVALAVRPTEGGMFSFDATDVVVSYDEPTGRVRVHYSIEGPNQTVLDDVDLDGVPDYVADAGRVAADALDLYEQTGFRLPISEAEFGLGTLGGSGALDLYLVDFALSSDGKFDVDTCLGNPLHCAGFMVVENDFQGYRYPSRLAALSVVVPHELFHGVQAAYNGELEVWASEGTAVWAERLFDPEVEDFVSLADYYLAEPTRSIDEPPVGPVPLWAYGTGLWFDFLTSRHDTALLVEILEAWEADTEDLGGAMLDALTARGDVVPDAWISFATYNLATGVRAGGMSEGYPYAAELAEVPLEVTGGYLEDDTRFYPLATTYSRLNHKGGPIWFALEEAAPALWFSLHPTADGSKDAPVLDSVSGFWAEDPGPRSLGDFPEGQYYVWGAQPDEGASSVKVRWCMGTEEDVNACMGIVPPPDGDAVEDPDEKGCGCATGSVSGSSAVLLALIALRRRRAGT